MGVGEDLGNEITNLDFGTIIGAPLHAAVNAQADAAISTINFLQTACLDDYSKAKPWVGNISYFHGSAVSQVIDGHTRFFVAKKRITDSCEPGVTTDWEESWREVGELNVRTINFRYDQKVQNGDVASKNAHSITIPLMTMVPIPYIRIDEMKLDFNVKLNGVSTLQQNVDSDMGVNISYNNPGGEKERKKKKKKKKRLIPKVSFNASWSRQAKKSNTEDVSRSYSMNIKVRAEQSEIPVGIERMVNLLDQLIMEDIEETV